MLLTVTLTGLCNAQIDDNVLRERISSIFSSTALFDGVNFEIENGVVTLSGNAPNVQIRKDAADIVRELEGAVYVVNEIELDASVNNSLNPAIAKLTDYLDNTVALLPLIAIALVVLAIFWLIAFLVGRWNALYQRLGLNPLLQTFVRQLVRAAIFLLGLVIALDIVGATPFVAAILGTAGVAGLAIGFAFRDIIENYLAGILISMQQPFNRNDLIQLGEHEGRVLRLTARELVLLTLEGNHVRIPNATVFKSDLINYSRNPRRRFDFFVGVDVAEDLEQVQELGVATLSEMNGVLKDPQPFSTVQELGEFNVILQFCGWVNQKNADYIKVKSQAIRLVKEAFDEAGVLMPEPITNVRLKQIPSDQALTEEEAPPHPKEARKTLEEARTVDVSLDQQLDKQIEEDTARSGETDLLQSS